MATRPLTLDSAAFPLPVDHNVGDQCTASRPATRTWSLPAVPCCRRRRRSYRRPLSVRASSSYMGLYDREPTAGGTKPEVESSPEVSRSWSMAELSSSSANRSVFRPGNVTGATSFQTCFNEDEEDLALTTSSAESDLHNSVFEKPSPRRRGVAPITSLLSPDVWSPRQDRHRLCLPGSGSRDRRSASMGTVRPSTIFRSRLDNYNADFGELLTSIVLHSAHKFSVTY